MADPTAKTGNDVVVTPQQQQQQQLLDQLDAILNDPSTHILIQRPPPNPFAGGAPRYPKPHTVTSRPTSPWGPVVTEPAPIPPRVQFEEDVEALLGTVTLGVGLAVGLAPTKPEVPGPVQAGGRAAPRPGGGREPNVIESIVIGTLPSDQALAIDRANPLTAFLNDNPDTIQTLAGKKVFNALVEKAFLAGSGFVGKVISTTGIDEALVGVAGANEEKAIAEIKAAEAAGNAVVVAVTLAKPFVFPGQNVAQALLFRDP